MNQASSLLRRCWLVLGASSIFGCSGEPAEIGDGPIEVDKSEFRSYAASWDGYVEAHVFTSGSDRLRVVLDESGSGWLQAGDGELAPPPTDPSIGYPPEARQAGRDVMFWKLYTGVKYPIAGARIELGRLRFEADTYAPYEPWCELQEPKAVFGESPPSYSCVSSRSYAVPADGPCLIQEEAGGEMISVDCVKAKTCIMVCVCDASACHGSNFPELLSVDAALSDDGEELTGTVLLPEIDGGGGRTIRLQRAP